MHGGPCDVDDLMCGRCMIKFQELDSRITATNIRVSNIEDSKAGNINSVIMVKIQFIVGELM